MSISFQDLQQATTIDDRDQLLIWQNSSGRNRRITRAALAGSRGFGASIVGVVKDDELAPNTPSGLTVSTGTETAQDGTERVYIRASINANTESDLDSYAWSIRRVSGTPTFDQAENLTGYGGAGQAFDPVITVSKTSPNSSDGTRMQWDVSANVWYEVRVRSIDRAGNASAFTPLNSSTVKISAKDNSIPLAPTNITINSAVRSVFLRWTNASDRDLAGVKIYRSNDQKLIASASRNGVEVTVNTTAAHGFSNGNAIIIAGLSAGTVNPNGQKAGNYAWAITVLSSTSFKYSLPSGTGTENYTVSDAIAIPFSNSSLIWNGYADSYTDTSITEQEQGTTFYYRLTSFDYSGNESVYQSAVKKVTPGQIDATDVKDFAITATKRWNNTIVLEGDQWFDQKSDSTTTLQNSIAWNQHSLYYQGVKYTVAAGNVLATTQIPASTGDRVAYVYATIPVSGTSITYQTYVVTTEGGYPTLTDSQFMIATNVNGVHDLAWNALANAVIGSAWIQNAAITNAKIKSLAADKIDAGTIESKEIILGGGGVFKSSGATSFSSGSGFWLEGGAGNVTKFGIGDLSGTTHGYLKWNQSANTLSIKGAINATSGTFGSGLGTDNTTGVKIDSNGLLLLAPLGAGNNGRIAAKIDWATNAFAPINTSGFYLGGNNDIYRFFIGNTGSNGLGAGANNLYWNGSSLSINGVLSGNIVSGTTIGTIGDSSYGLVIQSGFGLRYYTNAGVLTMTGGTQNGAAYGAQLDLAGNDWDNVNRGALVLSAGDPAAVPNSVFTGSISGTTLSISSTPSNPILIGMFLYGTGITAGTYITARTSATVYTVSASQSVGSIQITASADNNSGAIHFRVNNKLVGLWRPDETLDLKSSVWVSGSFYSGGSEPNLAPFKILNGNITATGGTIGGWNLSGSSVSIGNISLDATNQWIQAGPSSQNYVRISSSGIIGTSQQLGIVFNLPTDGSAPTFSKGEITLTRFTVSDQGVIRTSSTVGDGSASSAGVLINNTGIKGFTANQGSGNPANLSPNFHLDATDGSITAKAGNIGGWTLSSTSLKSGSASTTVGLEVDPTSGNVSIYAGAANKADAPFKVTNTGALTASNATITGNITATSGFIGNGANGFTINNAYIGNGKTGIDDSSTGVYLGTNGISLGASSVFKVTSAGVVTASSGTVGGWTLSSTSLKGGSTTTTVGLEVAATSGHVSIYAGDADKTAAPFRVTNTGALTASNATITGAINATSGYIGNGASGFAINNTYIGNGKAAIGDSNNGVYIGTDGIALGANSPFKVTNAGVLTASSANITGTITATLGSVGGWTIASSKLSAGGIEIDSTPVGNPIAATSIAVGKTYQITTNPSAATNFIAVGAKTNTVGEIFVATVSGAALGGSGTVTEITQKIQVGTSASSYVKIDSGGISGVDALLGTTFRLPTNGGRPTFSSGDITLTNYVISSQGVIRTSETVGDGSANSAGILINNVGIRGYAANQALDNPNFYLDASNGNIKAKAGEIAGWTISASTLSKNSVTIDSAGNIRSLKPAYSSDTAGFWIGYDTTDSKSKLYIGDANTYVKWNGTSLEIKGKLTFSDTSNTGLGTLATQNSVSYSSITGTKPPEDADVTLSKINGGLQLTGGGLYVENTAQIRTNNITWTPGTSTFSASQSGFFLGDGKDGSGNSVYRFFIGQTGATGIGGTNYLYWDGSSLKVGGNIVGGTSVGSSGSVGLVMNTQFGIRRSVSNQTLTMTGGDGNGVQFGAQIDLVGSFFALNNTSGGSGTGQLILQAGYNASNFFNNPSDGAIVLKTSRARTENSADLGIQRIMVALDGTVLIGKGQDVIDAGSTDPNAGDGKLLVSKELSVGGNDLFNNFNNGTIYVKQSANSGATTITLSGSNGDVTAAQFTTSSSKKVKTNIKKLKSGLETIDKLKPVSFKRKGTKQEDIGLIAEEVDQVIPVIVKHNSKNEPEGLDYSKLTVLLINAVKELSAEVKRLEKKIKDAN